MFDPHRSALLISVGDVAEDWGVSQERIRQLINNGKLVPDYYTTEPRYYWISLPPKRVQP